MTKTVYIVHCIDTEGPLIEHYTDTVERINATFNLDLPKTSKTLEDLQEKRLDITERDAVSALVNKDLLKYNSSWEDIDKMLNQCMEKGFRKTYKDDFDGGWVYSWHCMDHVGYKTNPRNKDIGFGNIVKFYKNKIIETNSSEDEINWHFHPLSPDENPLQCSTSYVNNMPRLIEMVSRRMIDHGLYPLVNRAGFHSERPDAHLFLEEWIPYDFSNQSYEYDDTNQPDLENGRFGDWRRAPRTWQGYFPHHRDYQSEGNCERVVFRCLNMGTRHKTVKKDHIIQAFKEASEFGSAVFAFCNHDYRDIAPDVLQIKKYISEAKTLYPDIKFKYASASYAAKKHLVQTGMIEKHAPLDLRVELDGNKLVCQVDSGILFGSQPFLCYKTKEGRYIHDNFDIQKPQEIYTYTLDFHTMDRDKIETICVGSASINGDVSIKHLNP